MLKTLSVLALLASSAAWCQTPTPKNGDTMQALLTEVHELRLAIEGMTVCKRALPSAHAYTWNVEDDDRGLSRRSGNAQADRANGRAKPCTHHYGREIDLEMLWHFCTLISHSQVVPTAAFAAREASLPGIVAQIRT